MMFCGEKWDIGVDGCRSTQPQRIYDELFGGLLHYYIYIYLILYITYYIYYNARFYT